MTKAAWIQTALRRRSLWLAAGASLLLVLFVALLLSQQDWHNRAAILERENTALQLTELAQELTAQSDGLAERARELAESDAVIRLVQETTDPSADRLELADMSRRSVDSLLVLNAPRAVRFSVTISDGQLNEQSPDPVLMQFAESIAAQGDGATRVSPATTFKDDRWIAVRPVIGHSSPAVLGWLVASRSLTPGLISKLAMTVGGALNPGPTADFKSLAAGAADGFGVATQLSSVDSSGVLALRDASGRVVRVLRLTRAENTAGTSPAGPASSGGLTGYVLAGLLVLLAIVGGVALALRRYFRHQRSVDARYKALIDQANDGIVIVDAHTLQVLYTNPAFLGRFGYATRKRRR